MKICKVTRSTAHQAVKELVPFKYNESAHGEWAETVSVSKWNSAEEIEQIHAHVAPALESYVIYSYETPIAIWNRHNGWWATDRYLTRTTSTHQGFVRRGM